MVCEHFGFDSQDTFSIELSAAEAVANCIKHAYLGAPDSQITVRIFYEQDRLELEVCDHGICMPEQKQELLRTGSGVLDFDPSDLAAVPESGMGLELIRQGMDEAVYSSDGRGNCLRLVKFLSHAEPKKIHEGGHL